MHINIYSEGLGKRWEVGRRGSMGENKGDICNPFNSKDTFLKSKKELNTQSSNQ